MSFITKRERVFNEYDLFDLPARNEGKLKAYASCTDARAWSHFCSDKSEHLVEIIKRNNDTCRPKYLPTDVIVETLMVAKNAEIGRLKRKIEEFEQLLSAYDELDLTCEQKCEIANAHAAIKAANKELDELCLDLDLSGYTEGIDSEAFETGKSRGDEPSRNKADETAKSKGEEWTFEQDSAPKMETKYNQTSVSCICDASTSATDPRVEEMQDDIIVKDAKLNAMQNTIAIMENDIYEPYCIYAHIYTALEKIFSTLCQNDKYKQYLDLLTAGKDTRYIDIKGKILFKLKVFEKFCLALIAPCSQDFNDRSDRECSCYHTEIVAHVETTFALTSSESKKPSLDNKRAQLVADIIRNDEMKEILSKESTSDKDENRIQDDLISLDNYSIDGENLKRLKLLQENYDDLMTCYETLKHEKNCLKLKCDKYGDLEKELETLRCQLREYNSLWAEKEYYKDRSINLDDLKQQYLLLSNEATSLETQLDAETQFNKIKSKTVDELRKENILLEKKLNDASIAFEKDKNTLLCKLNETECKVLCKEQQIKSLSSEINTLLEQSHETETNTNETDAITLLDQIEVQKEQIKKLQEALFCNEDEKQNLQDAFHDKIKFINELKIEIEEWKSTCDKTVQRNQYLEKYIDDIRDELKRLATINQTLSQELNEKTSAAQNLIDVVNNKSQEVDRLNSALDSKNMDNEDLLRKYHEFQEKQKISVESLEKEKTEAIALLLTAKKESEELLQKVKNYDDIVHKQNNTLKPLELQAEKYKELKEILLNTLQENKCLKENLNSQENKYLVLVQEIQGLRASNSHANNYVNILQNEREQYKMSYELTKKVSEELENKLSTFEDLKQELNYLRESREKLIESNHILESELYDKTIKLNSAINSFELSKKESSELLEKIQQYRNSNEDLNTFKAINEILSKENLIVTQDLASEKNKVELLGHEIKNLKTENENLLKTTQNKSLLEEELIDLKNTYDELLKEKTSLHIDFDNKTKEINNLHNTLKEKIEENTELREQIHSLKQQIEAAVNNIKKLETENHTTQDSLSIVKKESSYLFDKMKEYKTLEAESDNLTKSYVQIKTEKELLEKELIKQTAHYNKIKKENHELHSHTQTLLSHSEDLEKALISSRSEDSVKCNSIIQSQYTVILNEIEEMKKEKHINQSKIRNLLNKLDETEIIISDLSEQILARNDKIAVLENHINELEDEVRQLHNCLDEVVNAGEQIKDNSFHKIDQSLKKMEAHHSKAAHNMKMELAQLHNINSKLENQLSLTKLKHEDILTDKHKYLSQIINLQNEREIIVTDIKQLELSYVGDSTLSPGKCDIEDIITSLERIQKYLDAKTSRINYLEQTLFQVQTSSQLLLSKAEEAKKIVENEKQKIINEKEEVLRDRLIIEKQLVNLKETLEKQISCDQTIIRDLEAEILNKDLIIDKINKSTQNYISKLEKEIENMKELYENSLKKLENFQQNMQTMSEQNKKNVDIINKINIELQEKCKEIDILQKSFEKIKNMSKYSLGIQTLISSRDVEIQTEKILQYERYNSVEKQYTENEPKSLVERTNGEVNNIKPNFTNEVQVLNAKIDPTFNYVKNIYLSYKMKQLDRCMLEQYSISCLFDDIHGNSSKILSTTGTQLFDGFQESQLTQKEPVDSVTENHNLINIYNKSSMYTDSSRIFNKDERDTTIASNPSPKTPTKLSAFTELSLTNECFDVKTNVNQDHFSNLFNYSTSENSTDKDIFVIYQDNVSNDTPETQDCIETWTSKGHPEMSVEACTVNPNNYKHNDIQEELAKENSRENINYKDSFLSLENVELSDNSEKNKLIVTLPMVDIESTSIIITKDNKSVDSEKIIFHPFLKRISTSSINVNDDNKIKHKTSLPSIRNNDSIKVFYTNVNKNVVTHANAKRINSISSDNVYDETNITYSKKGKRTVVPNKGNISYHNLWRVDTDTLSSKNGKKSNIVKENKNNTKQEDPENFGIKYILDTINCEIQPEYIQMYDNKNPIRQARSNERIHQKLPSNIDPRPSGLRIHNFSSSECKSETNLITSKLTVREAPQTTFAEQSVMVKMDTDYDYENKIQNLMKLLENIEKDYKKKVEAIKMQYDNNVKCIINDHNEGVKAIQSIHEETFRDIIKVHENEIENLRSMSMEAMRKADKLEKENQNLKTKLLDHNNANCLDEEPIRDSSPDIKRCKKCHNIRTLTKTNIEAFNVKPKVRNHGPCTCSLEVNISETIRNIFEQVDAEQRRMAEHTYMKYIANKIINDNVEALDTKELSFLHLKVCRTWKTKMTKDEALQKRIDLLENELMHKQLHAQQHMANLDREVTEERRRLQELREAVCRKTPPRSRAASPGLVSQSIPSPPTPDANKELNCKNQSRNNNASISERRSAGDLVKDSSNTGIRTKRLRMESNRAVLVKLDTDERRQKKLYSDEPPTRLRKSHDRQALRSHKKL